MFCQTCKGNQRIDAPEEVHAGIRGIWTKICPDCKGSGLAEESQALREMRNSDAYKVGYLRSAIKYIILKLEHEDVDGAKLHAQDTLRTIRVDNEPDTL